MGAWVVTDSNEKMIMHLAEGLYRLARDAQSRFDTAKTAEEVAELRIIRKLATREIPALLESFVNADGGKWSMWNWYLKKTKANVTILPERPWWKRLLNIG